MIWNGTDPLQPDHEVAYRGWPTEQVSISNTGGPETYCIVSSGYRVHLPNGRYLDDWHVSHFDLIPLQQQEPKK